MKPLFVLAFIFVTAIAFAQNTPTAELGANKSSGSKPPSGNCLSSTLKSIPK